MPRRATLDNLVEPNFTAAHLSAAKTFLNSFIRPEEHPGHLVFEIRAPDDPFDGWDRGIDGAEFTMAIGWQILCVDDLQRIARRPTSDCFQRACHKFQSHTIFAVILDEGFFQRWVTSPFPLVPPHHAPNA